jgi:hypothetical protein
MSSRTRCGLVAVALCLVPLACSSDDGGGPPTEAPATTVAPQRLTAAQAELLASMRLVNYQAVERSFTTSVTVDGAALSIHGVVNWAHHVGSIVYTTAGSTAEGSHGLMQWNFSTVAAHAGGDADGPPPPPPADGTWIQRQIDPTTSVLDTTFLLLLNLGNSQPENPQLLAQSDARFLGTEIIGGSQVSVFSGPTSDTAVDAAASTTTSTAASAATSPGARTTYYVASDGTLVRFVGLLGVQTVTVDLAAGPDPATEFLPDLVTEG